MRIKLIYTIIGTTLGLISSVALLQIFFVLQYRNTFGIWPWEGSLRVRGRIVSEVLYNLRIDHEFGHKPVSSLEKAIKLALKFGHGKTFMEGYNPIATAGLLSYLPRKLRKSYLSIQQPFARSA